MDKSKTWTVFNKIAPSYDLLNRLLSFNIDQLWRRRLVNAIPFRKGLDVLDLGTGTGDVALSIWKLAKSRIARLVGLDPAIQMLSIASQKTPPSCPVTWVHGDAQALPFPDHSFDVVTMAFAIRNVPDPDAVLREIRRVLRQDGRALILEFSLPKSALIRTLYLIYFRKVLPIIGGLISKDRQAYRYLNESVEAFPYGVVFAEKMSKAGFKTVQFFPLTFGIATLYVGDKQ